MSDKSTRTAAELKLMIEEQLRELHPECKRAEVVINPPIAGRPWSAAIFVRSRPSITNAAAGWTTSLNSFADNSI
jgi:hypothetical protein